MPRLPLLALAALLALAGCGAADKQAPKTIAAKEEPAEPPGGVVLDSPGADPKHKLQLNLTKGKINFDTETSAEMQLDPKTTVKMKLKQGLEANVMDVDTDGLAMVDFRFKNPKVTLEGSSLKELAGATQKALEKLSFFTVFDRQAFPYSEEVNGMDNTDPGLASLASDLGRGFLGVMYPEERVGIGGEWSAQYDIAKRMRDEGLVTEQLEGGLIPIRYKLIRIVEDRATISFEMKGDVKFVGKSSKGDIPMEISSNVVGEAQVSLADGVPLNVWSTMKMSMTSGKQTMSQKMRSESRRSVSKN